MIVITMNYIAIFMLLGVFMLHQFYEDRTGNIGTYAMALVGYLFSCIGTVTYPFHYGSEFIKQHQFAKYKKVYSILVGVGAAISMVIILWIILARADEVFRSITDRLIGTFLNPWTLIVWLAMTLFAALAIYCLVCGATLENMESELTDVRTKDPVTAVAFMGTIAVLYLGFSLIQIVYLFLGKGTLPEGLTYSNYARQGFFQLLAVVFLNLIMVLCCIKYFKANKVLNVVLSIINLCTCIMIASAALLVALMPGICIIIYKNGFPLFRYCLVLVSIFYMGFAWMRPDRIIAEYNVAYTDNWQGEGIDYLIDTLLADAAPVVVKWLKCMDRDDRNFFLKTMPGKRYLPIMIRNRFAFDIIMHRLRKPKTCFCRRKIRGNYDNSNCWPYTFGLSCNTDNH